MVTPNPILLGTYTFESSENIDDYLKGLGVGLVLRKVQTVARPTYKIKFQADTNQWTFISESVFRMKEITFKPGEKFEDETFDGRKCQTSVEILDDGQGMKWTQTCEEGPDVETMIRAAQHNLTVSMKSGEFTCEIKGIRERIENQAADLPSEGGN